MIKLKNYNGNKFYNGTELLELEAPWNNVLSERASGKSLWWVKQCVIDYFKHKRLFGYVRRYDEDIKPKNVDKYFNDINFKEWLYKGTGYNGIICYQDGLYLYVEDENGKYIKKERIGYSYALNIAEKRYKSLHYDGVYNILLEEFITSGNYLDNEFMIFNNLISTICRRNEYRVIMLGNTVARNCPYLKEFGIDLFKTEPGKIYKNNLLQSDGNKILCCFDYVKPKEKTSLFFGKAEKSIVHGDWDVSEVPHLWFDLLQAELIYTCYYVSEELKNAYKIRIIFYDDNKYMYVYPYDYNEIKYVSDDIFTDTPDFQHKRFIHPEKKRHSRIREIWKCGRVLYSDNLCGTEFRRAMKKYNPFI